MVFAKKCGHKYLTLVYQIDDGSKRLLWIGNNGENSRTKVQNVMTGSTVDWRKQRRMWSKLVASTGCVSTD